MSLSEIMAAYNALLAEIRQGIEELENKGPTIIFNDPLTHIYLSSLKKEFPSMKMFPGAFDLVVIGEKIPPTLSIPPQFRFIRPINPSSDVMDKLNEIDRKTPVMLLDLKWKDKIVRRGFEIYCPPRVSPSQEPFRILSQYLLPDLSSLALGYLTVREVLVREWKISDMPRKIVVHPKGMIYVTDRRHDNIVIFNRSGKLLQTLSKIKDPRTIAISPQGELYVIDGVDNISVFTPGGKFLRTFIEGIQWYDNSVRDIAFFQDKVYVTDRGVKVFDLKGKLIAEHHLSNARGFIGSDRIAVSPDGKIYVSNYIKDYVWIFEHEGSSLKCLGGMNIPEAWRIAIAPWGELYISTSIPNNILVISPDLIYQGSLKREIFRCVVDMAVSPWGEIYTADDRGRVQVFERRYD
jgi:hypothetical protein